jgi:hypothetical protein
LEESWHVSVYSEKNHSSFASDTSAYGDAVFAGEVNENISKNINDLLTKLVYRDRLNAGDLSR